MANDLLEIGTIGKAHGLRGDVVVRLITNRLERVEPGSTLHTERGPLTVAASRPHQDTSTGMIVQTELRASTIPGSATIFPA